MTRIDFCLIKNCRLLLTIINEENSTVHWLHLVKPGYFVTIRCCVTKIAFFCF